MRRAAALLALAVLPACVTEPPPYDYGPFLAHQPHSILVLPPLNDTPDVTAPYSFLSTVTSPLAERGYYVFPVAVVDEMMRENGCPTPGEMHQVPPAKLREVFGADAVLYVTVKRWGTVYQVVDSVTTVDVQARLVDLATETQIWSGAGYAVRSSSQGQDNAAVMLVAALVNQVVSAATDPSHDLAPFVSARLVANEKRGMLIGPRHPGYAEDQAKRRAPSPAAAAPPAK